ncbi:MAG: PEGA domain-containing protein [Deltaproteobacteria bacterium]|nr:PEGA domain-containing protein [Nannocystaceae bacterium]
MRLERLLTCSLAAATALAVAITPMTLHASPDDPPPPQQVVVMPLMTEGELPAHLGDEIVDRLAAAIDDDAWVGAAEATSCADASCWRERAARTSATHLVQAKLVVRDRDYEVSAELIDGATGLVIGSSSHLCEICGYEELGAAVDDLAGALRRKLAASVPALPVLVIVSTPPGALVEIDGKPVGRTPLELPLPSGRHDVRVSDDGRVPQLRRVVLVDGVREDLALALPALPERSKTPPRLLAPGATMTALGLAGIGVGTALAVIDESPIRSRCGAENLDRDGDCRYRYDSLEAGIAIAVVGGAALAAGIALLVIDRRRGQRSRVALRSGGLAIRF